MVYNILAALFFTYYLINVFGLPIKIKQFVFSLPLNIQKVINIKPSSRLKPFDCNYCLSGWIGLVFFLLPLICSQVAVVLFGSAYLSKYIK
jgi:hypothetical protein